MMPCSTKCSVPCGIIISGNRKGQFEQLTSCSYCSLRRTGASFLSPVYLGYMYICWGCRKKQILISHQVGFVGCQVVII